MSDLEQVIEYTKTFQDIELATAIGQLKNDPAQLQQFLQSQQDKIYNEIIKQKDITFQKVYGDLNRATDAQNATIELDKRNKELADIHTQVYTEKKKDADDITEDKNLTGRKYEMNEWSINNKKETLFIFSMLFIMLSGLILITVLWRMRLLSSTMWVILGSPLIIIFILTVLYRSRYTDIFRNKRYWNRRTFEGDYGKIPIHIPSCPGAMDGITNEYDKMTQSIDNATTDIGNMTQKVASSVNSI
jgi:hypothetical protein